jgi:hypothetical protein
MIKYSFFNDSAGVVSCKAVHPELGIIIGFSDFNKVSDATEAKAAQAKADADRVIAFYLECMNNEA